MNGQKEQLEEYQADCNHMWAIGSTSVHPMDLESVARERHMRGLSPIECCRCDLVYRVEVGRAPIQVCSCCVDHLCGIKCCDSHDNKLMGLIGQGVDVIRGLPRDMHYEECPYLIAGETCDGCEILRHVTIPCDGCGDIVKTHRYAVTVYYSY